MKYKNVDNESQRNIQRKYSKRGKTTRMQTMNLKVVFKGNILKEEKQQDCRL